MLNLMEPISIINMNNKYDACIQLIQISNLYLNFCNFYHDLYILDIDDAC